MVFLVDSLRKIKHTHATHARTLWYAQYTWVIYCNRRHTITTAPDMCTMTVVLTVLFISMALPAAAATGGTRPPPPCDALPALAPKANAPDI